MHNNGKDDLGKFDAKVDEVLFLGFSSTRKAYWVYNKRTLKIEESIQMVFDESPSSVSKKNAWEEQEEFWMKSIEKVIQLEPK